MSEEPSDSYEAPSVEQIDAEDHPAVTAAGAGLSPGDDT